MPRKPPPDRRTRPDRPPAAGRRQARADPGRASGARSTGSTRNSSTLLNRRAEIAVQIGQVKQKQGLEVWSPAREDEVIAQALAGEPGPAARRDPAADLPRADERLAGRSSGPLRVACLGPKYSYSHLAAVAKFGEAVEHVPVGSIAAVFEEVNRRHVQFGIVPLENSTDGRIADTLDMFIRLPEPEDPRRGPAAGPPLPARQGASGGRSGGSTRRPRPSRSAATGWARTCRRPRLVEVVSTAAAAELAQREEFAAAVASRAAGRGLRPERPGREHRGPAAQRHPLRRHRRARRAAHRPATRRP